MVCNMAGIVSGQYGLGLSIVSWTIGLIVIGFIGAGIYWLVKPIKR